MPPLENCAFGVAENGLFRCPFDWDRIWNRRAINPIDKINASSLNEASKRLRGLLGRCLASEVVVAGQVVGVVEGGEPGAVEPIRLEFPLILTP